MGKNYRTNRSANRNNDCLNRDVIDDPEGLFGRATKALGHRRFQVETADKKGNPILVDAPLRGKIIWVNAGDIVILGKNDSEGGYGYEILGSCDKKTLKKLRDAKRLPASLCSETGNEVDDDIFDRNDDLLEDEAPQQGKPKAKAPAVPEPAKNDEEIEIDDI
jgi:translation initiation factor IF-1